jgi:hypothetical protein
MPSLRTASYAPGRRRIRPNGGQSYQPGAHGPIDTGGYGQGTGEPTLRRLIEDARRVADVVRPRLMGRSLGGVAAHERDAWPTAGLAGVTPVR